MDIRQLHYFLTLCEEMNYTRAAQRLFLLYSIGHGVVVQQERTAKWVQPFSV